MSDRRQGRSPGETSSMDEQLGKLSRPMPSSLEAETCVLSCVFHSPTELLAECRMSVPLEAFHHPLNRLIYQAFLDMEDRGHPFELAALCNFLREAGHLEKVGGPGALAEMTGALLGGHHFAFYKGILLEKLKRRQLIAALVAALDEAFDEEEPVAERVVSAQESIIKLTSGETSDGYFEWDKDVVESVITDWEYAVANQGHIPPNRLATGFTDLDRRTGGLAGGWSIILAARPSQGKTSLAMNIVENVALGEGHYDAFNQPRAAVAVYSLEMSKRELGQRSIIGGAGVNINQTRFGLGSSADNDKVAQRILKMQSIDICGYDLAGMSIERIRASARILKKKKNIRLIVIDYLQLVTSTLAVRHKMNRQQEVGYISKQIKEMAKELDIPVITLAQLNRNVEERGKDAVPKAADLRESGDIEQDADLILLIKRHADKDPEKDDAPDATIHIGKARGCSHEPFDLNFIEATTQFLSRTTKLLSNNASQRESGYQSKPQPCKQQSKPNYADKNYTGPRGRPKKGSVSTDNWADDL